MDDAASQTVEQGSDTLAVSVDNDQATTSGLVIDLSKLTLQRIEYDPDTLSDLGLEGEQPEDHEDIELNDAELQEFEGGYIRVAEYGIRGPEHEQFGTITIWYIDKDKLGEDFYWLMDGLHSETEFLASQLFDGKARFKKKFLTEGTGIWGSEVNGSTICYLESIKIAEKYRGKGIGTWALEQIWKIQENVGKTGLEDINFLFTLPAPTPYELTDFTKSHVNDPEEVKRLGRQEWDFIVNSRLNPFLRRVGFRRVGTTRFFCCARDANHPSKRIPIDQDANEFIPTRAEHFEGRDENEALDALFASLRQHGVP